MTPTPTIFVRNLSPLGVALSFHVAKPVSPASPGLRRAVRYTPFLIGSGSYVDACRLLECDAETAMRYLKASPDILHLVGKDAIKLEAYPEGAFTVSLFSSPPLTVTPPAPVLAIAAAGEAEELEKDPDAFSDTADVEPLSEPAAEPAPEPAPEPEPEPAPASEPAPAAEPEPEPEPAAPAHEERPAVVEENPGAPVISLEVPSAQWTSDKLKAYAETKGIMTEGRNKNWILRAIHSAGG